MEAIVLSRRDVRESDQHVSLYTKEHGKIDLFARGIKKIVSKNAGAIEPFSHVFVECVEGKDMQYLTSAQCIDSFAGIREHGESLVAAQWVMHIVSSLTKAGERDTKLFLLLLSWLRYVNRGGHGYDILLDGFAISCISLLGLLPRLDACVLCDALFERMAFDRLGLYFAGGGIVCPSCRKKKMEIGEEIHDATLKDVSNLRMLLTAHWERISTYMIDEKEKKDMHALVYAFVIYHSEQPLADWDKPWYSHVTMKRETNNAIMNNNP